MSSVPSQALDASRRADLDAVVSTLSARLAATAVVRDAAGGHAAAERQAIRDSGLLGLSIPPQFGGWGADWPTVLQVVRRLAQVDSALAHVLAFHHLQLATLALYGSTEQQHRHWRDTLKLGYFWGNALNPLDQRLLATEQAGGWLLHGTKSYASGSVGSDWLTISAHVTHSPAWADTAAAPEGAAMLVAVLPSQAAGVHVQADWDSFGQRQTDSGSVRFDHVFLRQADVLLAPGSAPTAHGSLRTPLAQLVLVNLYVGIAEGALAQGRDQLLAKPKPWFSAGVASALDDAVLQHRYGQLRVQLRAAQLAADDAAQQWQAGFERGQALGADGRGAVALAVSEAKVLAHRAVMAITNDIFELLGASATSQRLALDRFWRNARVHTLHDPLDIKLRELGRHTLTGAWPEPSSYA